MSTRLQRYIKCLNSQYVVIDFQPYFHRDVLSGIHIFIPLSCRGSNRCILFGMKASCPVEMKMVSEPAVLSSPAGTFQEGGKILERQMDSGGKQVEPWEKQLEP